MKKKSFGNKIKLPIYENENLKVNDVRMATDTIEFLDADDVVSARNFNRPIRLIYEEVENLYNVSQTLAKTLLGDKETCIISDIYEEFNQEGLVIGNYFDNKKQQFLRIPTGCFFINRRTRTTNKGSNNFNNGKLEEKYSQEEGNDFNKNLYGADNSCIIVNRPNVELYERELAERFFIDLDEQDNDIRVSYKIDQGKIKYSLRCKRSAYNETENQITTFDDILTIDNNDKFDNVFELTSAFEKNNANYSQKTPYYSLEETIPLFANTDLTAGNYTVFYILKNSTKSETDEYFFPNKDDNITKNEITYSLSKKYGIVKTNLLDNLKDITVLPLFKFDLNINNDNGLFGISNRTTLLEKINRSCLNIKDIKVSNNFITVDDIKWALCDKQDISDLIC